jgi:peptidylprolyl isomerase
MLTLLLAVGACGDGGPTEPEDVEFAASLGINLPQMTRLASGVYIQTTTPGTGTAQVTGTSVVSINYKLWTPNGTQVDAGALPDFPAGGFVPGFTQGIVGMKVGEVRKIVIPSRLGYGDEELEGLPANSVLVFEVTMVSFT